MSMLGLTNRRKIKSDDPTTWPVQILIYTMLPENCSRVNVQVAYRRYQALCKHLNLKAYGEKQFRRKAEWMAKNGWIDIHTDAIDAVTTVPLGTSKATYARREFDLKGNPVWPWWTPVEDSDRVSKTESEQTSSDNAD